jgi:hypothetical protein
MNIRHTFAALMFVVAAPVWAQSASPALNLQLPANAVPAPAKPAVEAKAKSESPASTTPASPDAVAMPAPYDQTYGARRDADEKGCDDATYTQPQLHGSVGMGVAAGDHFSGNYETATLVASKALGTCDHPKGDVAASITVTKGNINRLGRRP